MLQRESLSKQGISALGSDSFYFFTVISSHASSDLSCFPPGLAKKDLKAIPMSAYFHFAKTRVSMDIFI